MEKSSSFELRPHHGLCSQFFEGKGYSGAFVANMTAILSQLAPDTPVTLTRGADCICAGCPNWPDACGEKAPRYDEAVLRLCGLQAGQTLPFGRLQALAREKIIAPGYLRDVCGDCQWFSICGKK